MRWILLCLSLMNAVAAPPILHSTFDESTGSWTVMGGTGTLRVSREAADLHDAQPSLAVDYEIALKKFGVAILPVEPESLAAMSLVHFWVKTDYPTSIAIVLSEKGGGNYTTVVSSPGKAWQEVKADPRDFVLGENSTDPPDPDGKLDVDQLQGIGLVDLGQLFAQQPANSTPVYVNPSLGKHVLLISGFEVLGGGLQPRDNHSIDKFDTPQVSWSTPGGARLRLDDSRAHAPGPALEINFGETGNSIVFVAHNLPSDIPAGATHISFDIASEESVQLAFALQERGHGKGEGPRYNTIVEVNGGGKPDHRDLALSAFNLDENGPPDPDGTLKVVRAKSLIIGDISAATNSPHGPNKVWISNLRWTESQ